MGQEEQGRHRSSEIEETIREKGMTDYLRDYRGRYQKAMIEMASEARDKGVSHRAKPFLVGSAVLTVDAGSAKRGAEYAVHASHNFTPVPGMNAVGGDKRCAERNAIDGALLERNNALIVALTTVSRETSTGDMAIAHDVLHPCQECRGLLRQLLAQGRLKNESVLCSVNDADKTEGASAVIEETTVKELLALYPNDPPVSLFVEDAA